MVYFWPRKENIMSATQTVMLPTGAPATSAMRPAARPQSLAGLVIGPSFGPLGRIVARGEGHDSLPIVMLPHPIGEADQARIAQKGVDAAAECVRLLTTPGETVGDECAGKRFPLPEHAVPRG